MGCSFDPPRSGLRSAAVTTRVRARGVRREIERQQQLDRHWQQYQGTLEARIEAVVGARRAFTEHELSAAPALRQSLVDLASVCELLAGELEPPSAA